MKREIVVLGGVVLWSMLLAAILCGAASASEGTSTLEDIFGNANEDATIDMRDVIYTECIILGLNAPTRLADANYDGEKNRLDVTQSES
ncbi:hypothetical protein C5S32_06700 [ANME-1 cluster archaeon GoMg1]|nr:hypothetical protein [ANME-1 cluster archaeon GoMg1]